MTQTEQIWKDFNLEENCVEIRCQNQVRLYFAQFSLALRCLDRVTGESAGDSNAERLALSRYVTLLTETFKLLALKYFYDQEQGPDFKIDATDSGFFHFSHLIELGADLKVKEAELPFLPGVQELKEKMAEQIIRFGLHPKELQVKLARRLYLDALDQKRIVEPWMAGPLMHLGEKREGQSYFWPFATYDKALNRPFLYLIYFTYDRPKKTLTQEHPDFVQVMTKTQEIASGHSSLLAFAKTLDEENPSISPRIVKRVIIGPYESPIFTRVEGEFGSLLERVKERLPFALRWTTETLVSDRETRVGEGLFSRGKLKQIFWIPKDVNLSARGVSQARCYVLLPHWLGQEVSAAGLLPDHQQFVLDEHEEIHGID